MKLSLLYVFGILLLIVNSNEKETFDPDTKYFIYNKVTSRCLKRQLTNNGYTEYYTITYGECIENDDTLWYIKGSNIVLAANNNCFAIVNSSKLGAKECDKSVLEAQYVQDFVFESDSISTKLNTCLRDRRGPVGDKKNQDENYEWIISTSLPESE